MLLLLLLKGWNVNGEAIFLVSSSVVVVGLSLILVIVIDFFPTGITIYGTACLLFVHGCITFIIGFGVLGMSLV